MPIDPIPREAIGEIKQALRDRPRDYALFTVGVNLGLRASDLVRLRLGDFWDDGYKDRIFVHQAKTGRLNEHAINPAIREALDEWRRANPDAPLDAHLFYPTDKSWRHTPIYSKHLCTDTVGRMVKRWCLAIGLKQQTYTFERPNTGEIGEIRHRFSSHSLRHTSGVEMFNCLTEQGHPIGEALVLTAEHLGHRDPRTTAIYIRQAGEELREAQLMVNL
jgi:integrase